MCLVYKERVNTKLLKVYIALVLRLIGQFLYLRLQRFTLLFKVLNRQCLAALLCFRFLDSCYNTVNLLLIELSCEVVRHRQLLKLLIGYDNRIIFTGCNTIHKYLTVCRRKVRRLCYKQLRSREEVHKLVAPLCHKRLRNCKHRLLYKAQLLQLHSRRCHFIGLTCAYLMCKECITTRRNYSLYCVSLVWT